ncbi:MAG: hypothetical protein F6J98_14895 [Moorea sp. SIO4G2]|uniref:hypothetical protein n=1 Tax=unclassified Moorena TaxID=2683338 RepID=UPI0013C8E210|nr:MULTISPECIES: hypothetical protein [unclassified Moorena]NEO49549.1 hypothetical protein [Moorena sp. SIO4A3]NEO61648.1 hypothetical protein [Moorena sp. SIO4G2]NEO20308.1 hypothetical protein [Moorena sp. SIO4A5]NEP24047.1 hypothetical protein [Moorena sp. SIO3I6]NEQ60358.1 hypothetical protein [Moorena sp. SIO4A1]
MTREYQRLSEPSEGVIYTSMRFKPPGKLGSAQRDYFPLQPGTPERETFESQPAIRLWKATTDQATGKPQDLELSTIAFGSEIFYFVEGELKTIELGD